MAKASKKKKEEVQEEVLLPTVTIDKVEAVQVTEEGTEVKIETPIVTESAFGEEPTAPKTVVIEEQKDVVEETAAKLEESIQVPQPSGLSKQAQGWRDWLAYQRMTPEEFLERYPAHKMRHLIQEIITFNAQK